jgi:hypothetical protein
MKPKLTLSQFFTLAVFAIVFFPAAIIYAFHLAHNVYGNN